MAGALGLTDEVALYVAMGARWETQGEWRDDLHQPAIVVGNSDLLTSKALVRASDLPPALFPIDFALTTNGAHWIIDEPRALPPGDHDAAPAGRIRGQARHRRAVRPDLPVGRGPGRTAPDPG